MIAEHQTTIREKIDFREWSLNKIYQVMDYAKELGWDSELDLDRHEILFIWRYDIIMKREVR